jgi:hypothetical protein
MHIRRMASLAKASGAFVSVLDALHWLALVVFRVLGHLCLTAKLSSDRALFPHPLFFWIGIP